MRYAAVAYDYYAEGWTPLPLPARQKFPPPKGYTGASAKQPSVDQYRRWCNADRAQYGNEVGAGYNVAVVMPDDVIALDIDKSEGHKVKADGLGDIGRASGYARPSAAHRGVIARRQPRLRTQVI
jgi:hypothetical protein